MGKLAQLGRQCEAFDVKLSQRWARLLDGPKACAPLAGSVWPGAVLLCMAVLAQGCAGHNEFRNDADWSKDKGVESGKWREIESLFDAAGGQAENPDQALRGVRHDLSMVAKQAPDVRCSCLDVVVGRPQDPKFRWAGQRPSISHKNMVIAFRTKGSECLGASPNRRPSIQAVDVAGRDVIIVIEELPYNRPQALGAIVKRPRPGGALYVRSRKSKKIKLPYAQSSQVHGMCKIVSSTANSLQVGAHTR
ncbi:MAG: hypothetical protein DRI90_26975 [Deltaproteobacteria bacterium]|nr:MAG: hypothetical protein DRI90_26975 [Deltaproteobacteria bacterium]